jgi:hypothetical protein
MNADTDFITREMHRRTLTSRIEQPEFESAAIGLMGTLTHGARRTGSLH